GPTGPVRTGRISGRPLFSWFALAPDHIRGVAHRGPLTRGSTLVGTSVFLLQEVRCPVPRTSAATLAAGPVPAEAARVAAGASSAVVHRAVRAASVRAMIAGVFATTAMTEVVAATATTAVA